MFSARTGRIKLLSIAVALVILCSCQLEEKYACIFLHLRFFSSFITNFFVSNPFRLKPIFPPFIVLFRMVADSDGLVDQRRLSLMLHSALQLPRLLGEISAFGGSNIEPSVQSCLLLVCF